MLDFVAITQDQLDEIQCKAGWLLKDFNVENPDVKASDVICQTTGGVNPSCAPTYLDLGEDIDNVPNDTKELKQIDYWTCLFSFTSVNVSETFIKLSLGAADKDENGKIVPRATLKAEDFTSLWWVGMKIGGGLLAICLKNALSDSGFSLQTAKKGKGQVACTIKGHTSITDQSVPMEFYSTTSSDTAS